MRILVTRSFTHDIRNRVVELSRYSGPTINLILMWEVIDI